MQGVDQLPNPSSDASANSASNMANVSWYVQKSMCLIYIYNMQGANVGVPSRRKAANSWNTMVNEDNENLKNNVEEK